MTTLTIKPEVVISIKAAPLEAISHPEWPAACKKALAPYEAAQDMLKALAYCIGALAAGPAASDECREEAMQHGIDAINKARGNA